MNIKKKEELFYYLQVGDVVYQNKTDKYWRIISIDESDKTLLCRLVHKFEVATIKDGKETSRYAFIDVKPEKWEWITIGDVDTEKTIKINEYDVMVDEDEGQDDSEVLDKITQLEERINELESMLHSHINLPPARTSAQEYGHPDHQVALLNSWVGLNPKHSSEQLLTVKLDEKPRSKESHPSGTIWAYKKRDSSPYILAQIASGTFKLISIADGNRWDDKKLEGQSVSTECFKVTYENVYDQLLKDGWIYLGRAKTAKAEL